jgi:sodium/potassium-transporting ATPase subunit alpha
MPPMMPSVRWNATDEESATRNIGSHGGSHSNNNKDDKLRRRGSQRSIDPAAAIPIEYRSLSVPANLLRAYGR